MDTITLLIFSNVSLFVLMVVHAMRTQEHLDRLGEALDRSYKVLRKIKEDNENAR